MQINTKKIFDAIVEELYLAYKTIIHILDLLNTEKAMVAAGDGSGESQNIQLDYLWSVLGERVRYISETDSELRDRIIDFTATFFGGGMFEQFKNTITRKYTTLSEEAIKIKEPSNIYQQPENTYNNTYNNLITFIERPPDSFGYIHDDTVQFHITGATPSGDGIFREFRFVDVMELASYKIEMLENVLGIVGSAANVAETLNNEKVNSPFAGIAIGTSDLQNGVMYENEMAMFTITNLVDIEQPYAIPKYIEYPKIINDPTELVGFLTLSVHHTKFEIVE